MKPDQYAALFDLVFAAGGARPSLQLHGSDAAHALLAWAQQRRIQVIEYELTSAGLRWSAVRVPGDSIVVHIGDDRTEAA